MNTGPIPFVEETFNGNDIFVMVSIVLAYFVIFLLPKQFDNAFISFLLISYGVVSATLFDNTIGASPFDFYDIMDGPKYTIMDIWAYLIYGPYGYAFIYFYEKYKFQGKSLIFYIIVWTCFGMFIEWINVLMNVFTYKAGYKWIFSIPIYLFVQSFCLMFYKYIKK
ncbi:hypothetical protein [Sutcliffiella deserti]|uniref:hypothetical protein n=1 Tax=Sutcliffiella deserti TaxID=2875501 RepID=UPI001CC0DA9B|nr:hypothetical protein [Sutcliffiella deserti]